MSRVEDMPIYKQQIIELDSRIYNLWIRAKKKLSTPMRFPLTGYRGLVMILQEQEWLCANERLNDLPVICWQNFEDKNRTSLHLGIKCQLNYYHFAADQIQQKVLSLMVQHLEKKLLDQKNFCLSFKQEFNSRD